MSAALTLMTKDRKGPKISYQVLLIPATDASVDTASYHEFGTGRFLARDFMKYGWDLYAPDAKTRDNPYVSPLRASNEQLKGLPTALVITAENDPLRDEGEAYARKLKAAGVDVAAVRYNGMIHDFVLLNAIRSAPAVEAAIQQARRRHSQASRTLIVQSQGVQWDTAAWCRRVLHLMPAQAPRHCALSGVADPAIERRIIHGDSGREWMWR